MDVIACQRAGVAAAAPLGTALTEDQMELLWRLHREPTLCFDADEAGRRAASRTIDRALPLLQPGRSFRFATLSGGKDADDVLREQGPGALKAQLAGGTPLVEALFAREQDLEPLDTPERRTAFKSRLRQAANAIQDKELGGAYREELLRRFDAAFPREPASQGSSWRDRGGAPGRPLPTTPEARAAAKRLARSLDPLAAAMARGALDDPPRLDGHLEELEACGFGDPALQDLAKEIIRLRLEGDVLDTEALARHLRDKGFGGLLSEIDKAATASAAPFLDPSVPLTAARTQWSHAFESLTRMAALEIALGSAKAELSDSSGAARLVRLKADRDALKRALRTGAIWTDGAPQHG
jgi:DNA primase